MSDDDFAEVIELPSVRAREQNEDDRDLDELGLRGATDKHGFAKARRCWHEEHAVVVDPADRRCTCKACGAELDPYEVLDRQARRNHQVVARRAKLRRDIEYLDRRVEELKREERNAKARIRSAKKRAGLQVNDHGWPLCPECGEDTLANLHETPVPDPRGDLYCTSCKRVTARRGRAA